LATRIAVIVRFSLYRYGYRPRFVAVNCQLALAAMAGVAGQREQAGADGGNQLVRQEAHGTSLG
jgi:hypothetical protein